MAYQVIFEDSKHSSFPKCKFNHPKVSLSDNIFDSKLPSEPQCV
ncbi:hypothetical protein M8C21_022074, partial [Ambrosia artemisiifolia]